MSDRAFSLSKDPLGSEYVEFESALDKVLAPFHEIAVVGLQGKGFEEDETIKELFSQAETTEERLHDEEWERKLNKEVTQDRERLVGWLTLVDLVMLVELKLHTLKSYFDKSHPPNKGGYKGKSALSRLAVEYEKRFGIKLDDNQEFGLVKELVLARNAVMHNGGKPTNEYRTGRFVGKFRSWKHRDKQDVIVFSNQDFKDSLGTLKQFMDWLVRELMVLRYGDRPEGALRTYRLVPR
jgi:hypothetical protein